MARILLLIIVTFAAGFLTHAFFFPDMFAGSVAGISTVALPNAQSGTPVVQDEALATITFDGSHFSRHEITVGFTRYIQIINTSQTSLMWLTSSTPELATIRGYGYSEAVKMQANKKGTIVVSDKKNADEKLVITIK